jgi:phosphoglycolate phosphatase-like HAD superfamily hydrolase
MCWYLETNLTGSHALVSDLDGTLVDLSIDWNALKSRLGVRTITELWARNDGDAWEAVADAENAAARTGPLRETALRWIAAQGPTLRVSILTDNSRRAAEAVLARSVLLASRCVAIVGREELGGSKRDPQVFASGLGRCLRALGGPVATTFYLGDADYELQLAEGAGLRTIPAGSLTTGS